MHKKERIKYYAYSRMLYVYLQIISLIFSFTTSGFEIYRATNTSKLTYGLFLLFNLRLITSLFSSIYYTANQVDPLICMNVYKNVAALVTVISIRAFLHYKSSQKQIEHSKEKEEDNFIEIVVS